MSTIIHAGGVGSEPHKLAYQESKSLQPYSTWYYSDVCDCESNASKVVDYTLFVSQSYNFTGIIKVQGSDDKSAWADIDSISAVNGHNIKISSATATYRFFRFAGFHPDGGTTFKALMVVTEQ